MNSGPAYTEAVNRAKRYIRDGMRTGFAPDFDGQNMLIAGDHKLKSTVLGNNLLRQNPSELIAWAERDASGFDAASHGIAEVLQRGEELPPEAVLWLVKMLRQETKRPKKRTGPKGKEWKHLLICEAIRTLESEGMYPTRNDATSEASACDVVADALAALSLEPNTFEGVKDVWKKRDKSRGFVLNWG